MQAQNILIKYFRETSVFQYDDRIYLPREQVLLETPTFDLNIKRKATVEDLDLSPLVKKYSYGMAFKQMEIFKTL